MRCPGVRPEISVSQAEYWKAVVAGTPLLEEAALQALEASAADGAPLCTYPGSRRPTPPLALCTDLMLMRTCSIC